MPLYPPLKQSRTTLKFRQKKTYFLLKENRNHYPPTRIKVLTPLGGVSQRCCWICAFTCFIYLTVLKYNEERTYYEPTMLNTCGLLRLYVVIWYPWTLFITDAQNLGTLSVVTKMVRKGFPDISNRMCNSVFSYKNKTFKFRQSNIWFIMWEFSHFFSEIHATFAFNLQ